MKPTEEQQAIIDHDVKPGDALKVLAYAGAGKTTTLTQIAEKFAGQDVLYLAFNKSVEREAVERFPTNTTAKTGHALAFHYVGRRYRSPQNLYQWQLGSAYHLRVYEASILLKSYENFLCSADDEPNISHVLPDHLHKLSSDYADKMVEMMAFLFDDMQNERHNLPMTHSCYLKIFQLERPNLGYPIVLLDEAQDTNPVMHAIVAEQAKQGSKSYYVGDSYQQIYSWRGAQDAMTKIEAPMLRLSQSFRFGPAIAAKATQLLRIFFNETAVIRGFDQVPSEIRTINETKGYTILCRTNSGLIREAYSIATRGGTFNVNGDKAFEEFLNSLDQVNHLYCNRRGQITEKRIAMHKSFADLKNYADESLDAELMGKVLVMEDFGNDWPEVRETLRKHIKQFEPDVILSTCHKAKGLEWEKVRLAPDFAMLFETVLDRDNPGESKVYPKEVVSEPTKNDHKVHSEEINLIYVAATRAKVVLQPTADMFKADKYEQQEQSVSTSDSET